MRPDNEVRPYYQNSTAEIAIASDEDVFALCKVLFHDLLSLAGSLILFFYYCDKEKIIPDDISKLVKTHRPQISVEGGSEYVFQLGEYLTSHACAQLGR